MLALATVGMWPLITRGHCYCSSIFIQLMLTNQKIAWQTRQQQQQQLAIARCCRASAAYLSHLLGTWV
jgi:hypothetical protein